MDVAYYRCPKCGQVISGETVVDDAWLPAVEAHKAQHAEDEPAHS